MEKILYIIPGWEENCDEKPYQMLKKMAEEKGYKIILKNITWNLPLSEQVFDVPPHAVIFGFSLGAILAWLVAQKNICRLLLLASMTPHYSFEKKDIKKALVELAGKKFVDDVVTHLEPKNKAEKQFIFYGDQEEEKADIVVPNTQHELTDAYIEEIKKVL